MGSYSDRLAAKVSGGVKKCFSQAGSIQPRRSPQLGAGPGDDPMAAMHAESARQLGVHPNEMKINRGETPTPANEPLAPSAAVDEPMAG